MGRWLCILRSRGQHNTSVFLTNKLTNDAIKNTEMWHMRFGCSKPSTLHKTQKYVDDMPSVMSNPPLFKCPFCEKAKQTKYQGGSTSMREVFLPGQMFHMDHSFVSSLSNLKDVLETGAKPTKSIKKSREGYIRFLTIIDAVTRYLWN